MVHRQATFAFHQVGDRWRMAGFDTFLIKNRGFRNVMRTRRIDGNGVSGGPRAKIDDYWKVNFLWMKIETDVTPVIWVQNVLSSHASLLFDFWVLYNGNILLVVGIYFQFSSGLPATACYRAGVRFSHVANVPFRNKNHTGRHTATHNFISKRKSYF